MLRREQEQVWREEKLAAEAAHVSDATSIENYVVTMSIRRASWMLCWEKFAAGAWRALRPRQCCISCR